MEFDFYTKYQQLETEHLLALVAAPEKMQAAAMEAALKVLAEREVTAFEIEERKSLHQTAVIAEVQRKNSRKQSKIFDYLDKTFFEQAASWDFEDAAISLNYSTEERHSIIRQLAILLLVPALQIIVILTGIASLIFIAIEHSVFNGTLLFNLLVMLISLGIVVTISWFLLKRKKNAWSAMLIYTVYYVGNYIFMLYKISALGFEYTSYYNLIIYFVMVPLGAYSVWLLNKKSIVTAFELTRKRIENTWAIAIIFPVVLFFMIYLYS